MSRNVAAVVSYFMLCCEWMLSSSESFSVDDFSLRRSEYRWILSKSNFVSWHRSSSMASIIRSWLCWKRLASAWMNQKQRICEFQNCPKRLTWILTYRCVNRWFIRWRRQTKNNDSFLFHTRRFFGNGFGKVAFFWRRHPGSLHLENEIRIKHLPSPTLHPYTRLPLLHVALMVHTC